MYLSISSKIGVGTTIKISFPIKERRSWYVSRLKIKPDSVVVVVDDQIVMHRLWTMKLREAGFEGPIFCFFDQDEMTNNLSIQETKEAHFLVDYDLGENKVSGVDLLAELMDLPHRFLVTGHYDHKEIMNSCEQKGLFLIPKTAISSLPIVIG